MKKALVVLAALGLAVFEAFISSPSVSAAAPLRLAPVFSDNMVLQRNKKICVYGTGDGGGSITIGDVTKTFVSENGKWKVYFEPMKVSREAVKFSYNFGGAERELSNVLVGDVYLSSGQSNMELPLSQTEQADAAKDNSLLRFTKGNGWEEFTATSTAGVSAISVLFAQEIDKALSGNIPLGIISTSVGASRVDDWTGMEYCVCDKYLKNPHSDYTHYDKGHHDLYKKYIEPVTDFPIAGVLWYQGESNRGSGEALYYYDMFENMVNCWRNAWNDKNLPFYTVQIMLYTPDGGKDLNGSEVDEYNIRIAQGEAARKMKNVTMCSMLSYEDTLKADGTMDIHPTDKAPVAKALANAVLTTYYNPLGEYKKTPEYCGPLYKSITAENGKAVITFTHTTGGLKKHYKNEEIGEFEVRVDGGIWVEAEAKISGNKVVLSAEGYSIITGVRMGYRNRPRVNVYNGAGYCASPFIWVDDTAAQRHGAVEKWTSMGDVHYKKCTAQNCDERFEEEKHSGPAAKSCKERSICEICGYPYGGYGPHGETITKNAKEATETEEGYTGDLFCKDCKKQVSQGTYIPSLSKQSQGKSKLVSIVCAAALGVLAVGTTAILLIRKAKTGKTKQSATKE